MDHNRNKKGRGGSTLCEGSIVESYGRRISRCARPTLAAESIAIANCIDLALRHQIDVMAILFARFLDARPLDSDHMSIRSPFDPWIGATADTQCCEETMVIDSDGAEVLNAGGIYHKKMEDMDQTEPNFPRKVGVRGKIIKVIASVDCSNVFTSSISLQPRTNGKLTNITRPFSRDAISMARFSFLDDSYNLADCGTKTVELNLCIGN